MFHLDTLATLVAATLTLLLGRKLVHSVSFLKKYTIPEPVAGGLLVALALLVLKKSMGWEVNFDMSLRDPLMLAFFATIGLNANIASLRAGGRVVCIFLMAALFGTLMLASCTEMVISRVLHLARRIITPLVSGVVVMIIGLSLIQVGLTSIGGGYAAMSDNTFGAPKNLLLAGVVLALIILLNRQRNPYLRVASLVIAMAAGYALAWFMGMLPESNEPMTQELIMVPTPLYYGLGIEWSLLLPLMLVFMITSLETIGDITATSDVSEQPVSGPLYMKRLKGGVLANGLNSFVSAVFNTFPNSCFGQNNGVIQLTGVASRYVGFVVALMLIVLGLFPAVSGFVQHIPEPVLGGATLVMFGTIAASGVRIVSREPLNRRAILIIALSLAVGLGVSQQPLILQFAPEWLKNLLSSGIAAGGITAIVLNLIFPPEKQ